jgi:signal transduction histidine kinase
MSDSIPYVFRTLTPRPAYEPTLNNRQLLGHRLVVNSQLRFFVAGIAAIGPWLAALFQLMDGAAAMSLSALGFSLGIFNIAFFLNARRFQKPADSEAAFEGLLVSMYIATVIDFLVLAGAVAFLGGARSPFTAFYLLHVVLSCIMLSRSAAIGFTGLAFFLVCVQVAAEYWGIAPRPVLRPRVLGSMDGATAASIIVVYGALFAAADLLLISLVEWLWRSERALRVKNERLDRLSRLRRDFLHVAVHNLRSPVGASRMMVENLLAGLAGPLDHRQQDWVLRIGQRLEGLQEMLQDLDVLGELETEDVDQRAEDLALEDVALEVAREYDPQAEAVGLRLAVKAEAGLPRVHGIRRLLREAFANYVTNAIKYAPKTGEVVIEITPVVVDGKTWVRAAVRDAGEGIAPEHVHKLFREFSTPPKPSGAAERARGSGLGLSIVRRIIDAHGGHVGVDTEPGQGSSFYMELPGV